MPLCQGSPAERSSFIEKEWGPFVNELRDALVATKTRYTLGFSPEEVLPQREKWLVWADRNRALTEKWHGQPNVSALYELLMECGFYDGESVYRTTPDLKPEWSADGWTRCLDGKIRKAGFKTMDALKAQRAYAVSQQAGESQIDNTVLPNIMTAAESHVLLAGKLIKDCAVKWTAKRQCKCLAALSKLPLSPKTGLACLSPEKLREWLRALSDEQLLSAGVKLDSTALKTLRDTGVITASYGQYSQEGRAQIDAFLKETLGKERERIGGTRSELDDFVTFVRAHPGRIYQDDSVKHHTLLQCVLLSKDYVIVKRSVMAHFTVHRYFADKWQRSKPLIQFDENGGETEVRPAGAEEFSRFRKNNFPYLDSHGLSISSGGLAEDSAEFGTLQYEVGVAMATDGHAKLGNWLTSDFEKVLNEAVSLNPAAGVDAMLPGEAFHELCQNPRCTSSIGETQHVQISRGSCSMWPIMRLKNKPMDIPALGGSVDIVQIGNEPDALHVCVESQQINTPAIVGMFQQMRLMFYRKFGTTVDFILLTAPRGDGWIRASFVPLATIKKDPDGGEPRNAATGEPVSKYNLPESSYVDSTAGKGNMMYDDATAGRELILQGAPTLRRMYDFNRYPGARKLLSSFLSESYGYDDKSTGMCLDVAAPVVKTNGGQGPSLVDCFSEGSGPKKAGSGGYA